MILRQVTALTLIGGLLGLTVLATVRTPALAQSSQQAISVSLRATQSPTFISGYNVVTSCYAPTSTSQIAAFPVTGGGPIPLYFTLSASNTCTFSVNGLSGGSVNNNRAGRFAITFDGTTSLPIPLGGTSLAFPVPTGVSVSFDVTYAPTAPTDKLLTLSVDQASVSAVSELASVTNFRSVIQCDSANSQAAVRPLRETTGHTFSVNELTACTISLDLLAGDVYVRPPNIRFGVAPVSSFGSQPLFLSTTPIGQEQTFDLKEATEIRLSLTKVAPTPQVKIDVSFLAQFPDPTVRRYDLQVECSANAPGSFSPPAIYARADATFDAGRVVSLYAPINPAAPNSCRFSARARDFNRVINPPNATVTVKVNGQIIASQALGIRSRYIPISDPMRVEYLIGYASPPNEFEPIAARRLLDTRARPDGTSLKLTAGETVRVTLPQGKASAINVTATGSESPGYITVYPCGSAQPNASNLNFAVGLSKANLVLAQPGTDNQTCLFTSAPTHLIVDHSGTYPTNSSYVPQNPTRMVDTRTGIGGTSRKLNAGETFRLNLGTSDVASALTVTVTEPERTGYVTVYPCGSPQPNASNLNFTRNSSVANLVLAKAGPDGYACIFVSDPTHLLVDLSGTFPADSTYSPVAPTRILDTRTGIGVQPGKLVAGQTVRISVGSGLATALTVTATDADAGGYITVYPCDTPLPNVSNLNYGPGDPTANLVLSPMVGQVTCLFTSTATHLIADQSGSHPVPTYLPGRLTLRISDKSYRCASECFDPKRTAGPNMLKVRGLLRSLRTIR